jgi:hypothetical protein
MPVTARERPLRRQSGSTRKLASRNNYSAPSCIRNSASASAELPKPNRNGTEDALSEIARLKSEIADYDAWENAVHSAASGVSALRHRAANGHEGSILTLTLIATSAINTLNSLIRERPKLMRRIAFNDIAWPALISHKREVRKANDEILRTLQLKENGNIFSNRKWQLSAPSTQVAISLIARRVFHEVWSNTKPKLTKGEKRDLFEVLWTEMLADGVIPEQSEKMAPLGKGAAGKRPTNRGMSEQTPGMAANDIRAEIKRQVWKAFDSLIAEAGN